GAYSLIAKAHKIPVEMFYEDYVPRTTLKKPQPAAQVYQHNIQGCETAAMSIIQHVIGDIQTFRNGDPQRNLVAGDPWAFLANPNTMLCSPKFCRAHGTEWCKEWRHNKED